MQHCQTKARQIERVRFVSPLSKGRNVTKNSFDIVAKKGNKVDRCFDIVGRGFRDEQLIIKRYTNEANFTLLLDFIFVDSTNRVTRL